MTTVTNECCICRSPCENSTSNPMLIHPGSYGLSHAVDKKCMQAWLETKLSTKCLICGIRYEKRQIVTEKEEKIIKAKRIIVTCSFAALAGMVTSAAVDLAAAKIVDVWLEFFDLSVQFLFKCGPENVYGRLFLLAVVSVPSIYGACLLLRKVIRVIYNSSLPVIHGMGDSFRGFDSKAFWVGILAGSQVGLVFGSTRTRLVVSGAISGLFAGGFVVYSEGFAEIEA